MKQLSSQYLPSKKTSIAFRFDAFILSLMMCCSLCTSCSDAPPPHEGTAVHTTDVIRTRIQEYGNTIYCTFGEALRYDRSTNILSSACIDESCNNSCPLDAPITELCMVADQKLFFYSFQAFTHYIMYGYQDLITGEVTVLTTLSDVEDSGSTMVCVYDNYMYYERKLLREDGDVTNPNDYLPYICRVSVSNGKEEIVKPYDGEALLLVVDNKMVLQAGQQLISYDLNTCEKKTIFDLDQCGYMNISSALNYLHGKIYFMCRTHDSVTSEYKKTQYLTHTLVSVDIQSGEWKKVVDEPIITFCLTDTAIYYSPFKLRHMYIPDNYEQNPQDVVIFLADETLKACDLDGQNKRDIYSNSDMDYIESYTVIDGTLYGWMQEFNQDEHRFGDVFWGRICFDTGSIAKAIEED